MYYALLIVVIIIVIAVVFYMYKKKIYMFSQYTPTPLIQGQWDSNGFNDYTCPNSLTSGFCDLKEKDVQAFCKTDPKCIGYLYSEEIPSFTLPDGARLGRAVNQAYWSQYNTNPLINTTFYKKNQ